MESSPLCEDPLKNYYHQAADRHAKDKNYKSAYVYYTEAAEKYFDAIKMWINDDLKDSLKEKWEKALKKGEVCKKRHKESQTDMDGIMNLSIRTKYFKDLTLKEQSYIFNSIDIYKDLANAYTEAFGKAKDNQFLHAVFAANKAAAFAYILASKAWDDEYKILRWNAEGKKILTKTEQMKDEISKNEKYDKWSWLKNKYTSDERLVINRSSIFNGIKANPWLVEDGVVNIIQEKLYEDPDGFPSLSSSQSIRWVGFKRARDFVPKKFRKDGINVGDNVSGFEVNQNSVGDCSVIASLALAAHMECKMDHKKRLITCNIYPQDQYRNPIYNPFGQYVVKLYVNGLWRAVTVDDFFPVDNHNNMLWWYSTKGKLWCSLLEKAYLKMWNGYNFRGSNTSRDLFIFTSWLPERSHLDDIDDFDILWRRLLNGNKSRDVMVSISSSQDADVEDINKNVDGESNDENGESFSDKDDVDGLGIVKNHAYAVLEFKEVDDQRFVLVLNPWGRACWTGDYNAFYISKTIPTVSLKTFLGVLSCIKGITDQ